MIWINYPLYALITGIMLLTGTLLLSFLRNNKLLNILGHALMISGILVFGYFIADMWIKLDRPPLRTRGETRLWYAIFLAIIGYMVQLRWRYWWLMGYSVLMSILFMMINYFKPETYDETLMPALQSPWFVPHVVVYLVAYAFLGFSTLTAFYGLYTVTRKRFRMEILHLADNIVYIGFSLLTLGIIFGALWAKVAWGHYWTWDPKEIWALLTWLVYLVYMHFRYHRPKRFITPLWTLAFAFVVLILTWFFLEMLPAAQNSVHVYSQTS